MEKKFLKILGGVNLIYFVWTSIKGEFDEKVSFKLMKKKEKKI